ncbi:hypothetical protein [Spiroplasma ixodetis]|uniref:hypothetical protein n=1 Tax=Spiroplasma ixodetis TaxID=2141 RepID=UPI0025757077|nr:hypothetical protein [Spiroplasma ixodetis]WJG70525.1 hypothetical protein SIXOD_v1c17130 [Spiroplasma ixodetis Y32]
MAFVQQAIAIKDKLELTIAGQSLGAGYDYWVENKLKPEVLKPLVKNDGFNNIVVAYGGPASARLDIIHEMLHMGYLIKILIKQ